MAQTGAEAAASDAAAGGEKRVREGKKEGGRGSREKNRQMCKASV
jgi:hypothetical protein